MRATFRNYMDAVKARREENGDAGFSLIELIVVVVILGILAAVAIPVFLGLQGQAEQTAQDAVAANAASQAAAAFAQDDEYAPATDDFANLAADTYTITPSGDSIDNFCITVSDGAEEDSESGPGCTLP
ncbi:type II secretion system protein [Microbacterium sp. bgisy189]|uniref:type II secretion system protein n=1 Tax=Microbacterium sp. bgisy189 TaxID=3413798 RepID=UPI003EBE5122